MTTSAGSIDTLSDRLELLAGDAGVTQALPERGLEAQP
jgi:hypothetical protein